MALFASLMNLKDAIRHETEKQRNAKLDGAFPRIISGAEQRMFYGADAPFKSEPLRLRCMEETAELTLSSGSVALPGDFLQAKRFDWPDARPPLYEAPDVFFASRYISTAGAPLRYTVDSGTLYVSPKISGTITLSYYALPDALEDENDSNAMLLAHPMVYFDAALIETYRFLRNAEQAAEAYQSYISRADGLARSDARARMGTGGPLAPRIPNASIRR